MYEDQVSVYLFLPKSIVLFILFNHLSDRLHLRLRCFRAIVKYFDCPTLLGPALRLLQAKVQSQLFS